MENQKILSDNQSETNMIEGSIDNQQIERMNIILPSSPKTISSPLSIHSPSKPEKNPPCRINCNHCDFCTDTHNAMKSHLSIAHPGIMSESPSNYNNIENYERVIKDDDEDKYDDEQSNHDSDTTMDSGLLCPLCQDAFNDKKSLENHVMNIHSVNSDGLTRLLQLVDTSHWLRARKSSESFDPNSETHEQFDIECNFCGSVYKSMNDIYLHAIDNEHYLVKNEIFCCILKSCTQVFSNLIQVKNHFKDSHMNIVISERHVYKYRCKLCSLAFKTQDKLKTHSLYHTIRDSTKCNICNRSFRSTTSLQKHMEMNHSSSPVMSPEIETKSDIDEYTSMNSPSSSIKQEDIEMIDNMSETTEIDDYLNSQQMSEENYTDANRKYRCHKCKVSFTQQVYLFQHYKSNLHRLNQNDVAKMTNYPI